MALGDWGSVKAAPGVGPKIAQRVVNELKGRAPAVMAMGGAVAAAPAEADGGVVDAMSPAPLPPAGAGAQAEALSALTNLGYAPSEAASAVARAAGEAPGADTPALIRAALRALAPA